MSTTGKAAARRSPHLSAVHIAVAAAQQGRNVALIDTDPQQSAAVVLPLPPFMLTSATVLMLPPGGGVRAVRACPFECAHFRLSAPVAPFLEARPRRP